MSKKPRKRSLESNEAKAITRSIRISPRKLNEVATEIRAAQQQLDAPHTLARRKDAERRRNRARCAALLLLEQGQSAIAWMLRALPHSQPVRHGGSLDVIPKRE